MEKTILMVNQTEDADSE